MEWKFGILKNLGGKVKPFADPFSQPQQISGVELTVMLLEIHCHSSEHSSCSHVGARQLVERVFNKGLQGIVLTSWPERIRK